MKRVTVPEVDRKAHLIQKLKIMQGGAVGLIGSKTLQEAIEFIQQHTAREEKIINKLIGNCTCVNKDNDDMR